MAPWWNWDTRRIQVPVPVMGMRVRLPPELPFKEGV